LDAGNFYFLRKKIKFYAKINKIVYKYEGGTRQHASDHMPFYRVMPRYKTLKRCHLPDLDLTIPVSHEITWGRPLSQEEIDRMNAVFGDSRHGQDGKSEPSAPSPQE